VELHPWTLTLDEAEDWQRRLAGRVDLRPAFRQGPPIGFAAVLAVDPVARGGKIFGAGALVSLPGLHVTATARVGIPVRTLFPFVPGLESFRHVPVLRGVLAKLGGAPDVLVVEGAGVAHRRRFGVASHLGLWMDRPSVGVSAVCEHGEWEPPPPGLSGAHVFIKEAGEPLGLAVRLRAHRDPLFVSPGHKMSLLSALDALGAVVEGREDPEPFWSVRALLKPKGKRRAAARKPARKNLKGARR